MCLRTQSYRSNVTVPITDKQLISGGAKLESVRQIENRYISMTALLLLTRTVHLDRPSNLVWKGGGDQSGE